MVHNIHYIITICFLFLANILLSQELLFQSPVVVKSVLTSAGSRAVSHQYTDATGVERTTKIQQSIGQNGVVGLSNTSNHSIQQGYLNRFKLLNVDNSTSVEFVETRDLMIYPNPFKDFVKIKFSKPTNYPIQIDVFDVRGRLVLNREFPPSGLITVSMDRLEDASYIIRISSGSDEFLKKLIKGNN